MPPTSSYCSSPSVNNLSNDVRLYECVGIEKRGF